MKGVHNDVSVVRNQGSCQTIDSQNENLPDIHGIKSEVEFIRNEITTYVEDYYEQLEHLNSSELSVVERKKYIRNMHSFQRKQKILESKKIIEQHISLLKENLAYGSEVNPNKIAPEIIQVKTNTDDAYLFRLASFYWSVPVSNGYGRRMRFLVKDKYNDKLIGLFTLTDPVMNLGPRDDWIGWDIQTRMDRLRYVMDICVLGALPPYSQLLGGKFVGSIVTTNEIREQFKEKYSSHHSELRKRKGNETLTLLTTTSALGKSSLYDRLKIMDKTQFIPIGYTKGYGHFHISNDIFNLMRRYLKLIGHKYENAYKFGQGPNWKMRVIRETLRQLGINSKYMKHGIQRQIYVIPLANNSKEFLTNSDNQIQPISLPLKDVVNYCKERWVIPRSQRDKRYLDVDPKDIINDICTIAQISTMEK